MSSDQPERLDLATFSPTDDRLDTQRAAFPEVFREDKVDFDTLRRALGDWVDPGPERFGLSWPGKAECMRVIQEPSIGTLVPMPEDSVDWDTTQNVIIEGENLEVLKLLQKAYYGKVKLIYIDPPYNTGKEFIYPDNFREGLTDYLRYSGQVDEEGFKLSANTETDGRYHSKWLSMMYPRLFLARNLLSEAGFLCVSIGNEEISNLRLLLDEVFGPENLVALIVRRAMHTVRNSSKDFNHHADYVLMYARAKSWYETDAQRYIREVFDKTQSYPRDDGDGRGPYKLDPLTARNYNRPYRFVFRNGLTWEAPEGSYPRYSEETLRRMESENRIVFGGKHPMAKRYLAEVQEGRPPDTILDPAVVGFNSEGTRELREALGQDKVFPQPKPVGLIKYFLQLVRDESALVLDFFSGSGTTAEAVVRANLEDGGSRRFLLVQLPEPMAHDEYSTIADLTRARVRGVQTSLAKDSAASVDAGFRAYQLQASNFTVWDTEVTDTGAVEEQLTISVDHLVVGATEPSMLTELLLKAGYPLTSPVEEVRFGSLPGFSVADGALLVCLSKELSIDAFEAMVQLEPAMILVLDAGFGGSDELKVNALQTVRARNQQAGSDIALRVV